MPDKLQQLKDLQATIVDLRGAATLLSWDQETYMPEGGAQARADQVGTLRALAHQFFVSDEMGVLLDDLLPLADELADDSDDAALIRITKREYDKDTQVPVDLVREREKTTALAKQAWRKARAADDFSLFEPLLRQMVDIQIQWSECFTPVENVYDPLLDKYEPGLTYEIIGEVFAGLKPPLVDLVGAISANAGAVDAGAVRGYVPQARQEAFHKQVVSELGYDFEHGRLDVSAHPFTSASSYLDARLTTRFSEEEPLSGLMSSIHESGHGMHRQNVSPSLYRTVLWHLPSQAVAESQSRLYENNLGRSRAFWAYLYPKLQAAYAPAFDATDEEDFWKAVNHVEPSLIRVEADEVTYGLHIILRFELENDLLNGRVAVKDLPAEWNARMEQYLGVVPPSDAEGVLQDIHWSMGYYGYFPDYLLGSIWAVQLWKAMAADLGDVDDLIRRGTFAPILDWQRRAVMQHGVKFTLPELSQRALGEGLRWEPYMDYLREKYKPIYEL